MHTKARNVLISLFALILCTLPGLVLAQASTGNLAEVWVKPLGARGSGTNAVALINLSDSPQAIAVNWAMLGAAPGTPVTLRDVWSRATVGTYTGAWTNTVPANSVQLFRATAAGAATGVTTNISVLTALPNTFSTFYFTNGILMRVQ